MAASSNSIVALFCGVSITLLSGCSLLNPLKNPLKRGQNDQGRAAAQAAPKANSLPTSKSQPLDIALETARLAEQRGLDREAIAAYVEVRQLAPERKGIAHPLAVLYDRSGMTDAASKEYEQALKETPKDADVHCDYGYFLYSTGKTEEAERHLREAMKFKPKHKQATVNLALVLGAQGQYEESERLFAEAVGPAAAKHNVGMLKLRAGDRAGAKQLLEEAAARDPSIQEGKQVIAWIDRQVSTPVQQAAGSAVAPRP